MVRLSQNYIRSFDKVLIDFADYCEEFHRAASNFIVQTIAQICFFK